MERQSFKQDDRTYGTDTWGHPAKNFMNGWYTEENTTWTVHAQESFEGQVCYCIEPGVHREIGDTYSGFGENFWDNYPSSYNNTIEPDISILFDSDNDEKTFMASMAFSKRVLVFAEDELNRTVNLLLQRHEMRLNDELSNTEENEHNRYSQNESINELIIKVLKGEQIAVDLISYFDDAPFERDLCEEAFYQLERIMAGVSIETAQKASIVCALSLIAQKYYDGDLHSYIERKFREYRPMTENKYSRTVIQSGIYLHLPTSQLRKNTEIEFAKNTMVMGIGKAHQRVTKIIRVAYDKCDKPRVKFCDSRFINAKKEGRN